MEVLNLYIVFDNSRKDPCTKIVGIYFNHQEARDQQKENPKYKIIVKSATIGDNEVAEITDLYTMETNKFFLQKIKAPKGLCTLE